MDLTILQIDWINLQATSVGSGYSVLKLGAMISTAGLALMAFIIGRFKKILGRERLKSFIYAIIFSLLCALSALFASAQIFSFPLFYIFIAMQGFMLVLGIIHLLILPKIFRWARKKSFWPDLLFTIAIVLIGSTPFIFAFNYIRPELYNPLLLGSFLPFLIPTFFMKTFEKAIDIPTKVYRKWYFPVDEKYKQPSSELMKNMLVIGLEFNKRWRNEDVTNFRVKAPEEMDFEKLFYFFINEYNIKHPEDQIDIVDSKGQPQGWVFYKKPKWYSIFTHFVQPERTINKNNLRENSIVICERT